jgi:hypothetical protein
MAHAILSIGMPGGDIARAAISKFIRLVPTAVRQFPKRPVK